MAVLERARCGGVDTSYTSAHLTAATDVRLSELVTTLGEDHARASWDAGFAAIARIDQCIRDEQIDCDFAWVPGYLHADAYRPATSQDVDDLRAEADTAAKLGFDAEFVGAVPFFDRPGVRYDGQARIHPRKYLAALAQAIDGDGSFIFEHSDAGEVHDDPPKVSVGRHTVTCGHLIVATHNPIVGKSRLARRHAPADGSLALQHVRGRRPRAARAVCPTRCSGTPTNRTGTSASSRIAGSTTSSSAAKITRRDKRRIPARVSIASNRQFARCVRRVNLTHRWSGQVIETNDGLPYIGEMAPHQFAATGFAGNGLTFGTLAGMMAVDAVAGRENPWAGTFDIGRTKIRGGLWDYIKENKDYPYYLVRDRFAGVESRSLRSLAAGEGTVVEVRGKPTAAYRRDDGRLVLLSPVCTHMGCFVRWNAADRTWDCPCHGSRFRAEGGVLSGPAESPLKTIS